MQKIEAIKEFDGWLSRYQHASNACRCDMTFSVYMPAQAEYQPVPVLYWLSGLTCTDENFREKAGAQRYAAEQGIALVIPDTSPRGEGVPDSPERYDLGQGAGFYINATQPPWSHHYHMYDYVTQELPQLIENNFSITDKRSICGHSMGGHGALICALKNPGFYQSVSAFAPICHPVKCPWGEGIFHEYLGEDKSTWNEYDACFLIESGVAEIPLRIDQGTNDEFLAEQLMINELVSHCEVRNFPLDLTLREGYDHSYHFISTFIGEHIRYHAENLR